MLVQEGRVKVVLEKQDQCRVELGNIEAELKQLQEKKDSIMKQQEVVEKDAGVSICSENLIFSCPTFWPD